MSDSRPLNFSKFTNNNSLSYFVGALLWVTVIRIRYLAATAIWDLEPFQIREYGFSPSKRPGNDVVVDGSRLLVVENTLGRKSRWRREHSSW